jgi:hypothetical protein
MARTAYELHAAAQEAAERGWHEMAARLLMEAADVALTEGGRRVLLELAVDAAARACAGPESNDDPEPNAAGYHELRTRGRAPATIRWTSRPLISTTPGARRETLIFPPVGRGRHGQAKR